MARETVRWLTAGQLRKVAAGNGDTIDACGDSYACPADSEKCLPDDGYRKPTEYGSICHPT